MLFASINGEKVEARPRTVGICPLCDQTVISKCGEINVWHWAHQKDESCDSWYEPETEWHKNWKLSFGRDNCEVIISKEGRKHVADVYTQSGVVIELQNSSIQRAIVRQRKRNYDERKSWVLNGEAFKNNFEIYRARIDEDEEWVKYGRIDNSSKKKMRFRWSHYRKTWCDVQRHVFIDFGDEDLFWVKAGMGTKGGEGVYVSKQAFIKKYGGDPC